MSRLKELREKRAAIHAQTVEELKKEQTPEIRQKVTAMFADIDALGADIANIERADRDAAAFALSALPASQQIGNGGTDPTIEQRAVAYHRSWVDAMKNGFEADRRSNRWRGARPKSIETLNETVRFMAEQRDLGEGDPLSRIGTYTGLGFFVPQGFVNNVEVATKWFAPLMDGTVIEILDTLTGNPLPFPTNDDTAVAARVIGEQGDVVAGSTDITAGHVLLAAWKYTTDLVKVSLELLQDSAFDLETFLTQRFAVRLGRGYERDLTIGNGVGKPTGIITDVAASGAVAITAVGSAESSGGSETGTNSIGYSDLVRLEHSVDPSYRRAGKFMFHDQTLSRLKRIIDKFGRPLWVPGMKEGAPDTINGYGYVINQSVSQIAPSSTTVVFGDLKKFLVRRVKDFSVVRLDERFADAGQVAFVGFSRIDSRLIDAGTHPVNVLKQAS